MRLPRSAKSKVAPPGSNPPIQTGIVECISCALLWAGLPMVHQPIVRFIKSSTVVRLQTMQSLKSAGMNLGLR